MSDRRALSRTSWRPPYVPPGHEWWTDTAHNLAARVTAAERRGDVERYGPRYEIRPGWHGQLVHLAKPRPPAWRRTAMLTAAFLGALAPMVLAIVHAVTAAWAARETLAAALVCLVVSWLLLRRLGGHRGACPGVVVHCRCHR